MDLGPAADIASPFPHAAQTVAFVNRVAIPGEIEFPAIIRDAQTVPPVYDPEIDTDFGSTGVPQHVMNSLFEDEEDLPPQIGYHPQILLLGWRVEPKPYVPRGENVTGETPHTMEQVVHVVSFRVNGPDNIAHRIHQIPRDAGDIGQWLRELRVRRIYQPAGNLAEDGDLGEAGADVVVQVRGDPGAHALEFQQPRDPVAVEPINRRGGDGRGQQLKPPAQPNRRQNHEADGCRLCAGNAFGVDGADQKPVRGRREVGVMDAAGERRRAPTRVGPLHHVLIPECLPRGKRHAGKTHFYAVGGRDRPETRVTPT